MCQTLADAEESINLLISEARKSARARSGFAAMNTIFPVILAVSETIIRQRGNERLLKYFVRQMTSKTSWLVIPQNRPTPTDEDIAKKLNELRDGLSHQMSGPEDVILADSIKRAKRMRKDNPQKYVISTLDFVDTVDTTVKKLILRYPKTVMDPDQSRWASSTSRSLGIVFEQTPKNWIGRLFRHFRGTTSGSGFGS